MIDRIKALIKAPFFTVFCILFVVVVTAIMGTGVGAYFTQGGLVLLIKGVIAAAYFFGFVRMIRFLALTIDGGVVDVVRNDPIGIAILATGNLMASAIVTSAVFG